MDWDEMRQFGEMGPDDTFELSVPLPTTQTGKVRRCCPNPDCQPGFFLLGDGPGTVSEQLPGMRRLPQSAGVTCPYCGTDAGDDDWMCSEDLDHALEQVGWAAERDTASELRRMADDFNREVGGGLFGISMRIEGGSRPRPQAWIEDLLRELACDRCGREYGVYAIGLFCPDCGATNLAVHFDREVELIDRELDLSQDVENREMSWRLLGNAHEDVLTALETYLKVVYRFVVDRRHQGEDRMRLVKRSEGNAFQNPDRAAKRYTELGIQLLGDLEDDERQLLDVYVHTRHVIGHNLGLVDERFTDETDRGQEGQTVPLVAEDVRRFAEVAAHVIRGLEDSIPELAQP